MLQGVTRVAAILLEIDANELNNTFASQDFFIFKIGKIDNYLREPNSHAFVSPNDARSAKFRFYTQSPPPSDDYF